MPDTDFKAGNIRDKMKGWNRTVIKNRKQKKRSEQSGGTCGSPSGSLGKQHLVSDQTVGLFGV